MRFSHRDTASKADSIKNCTLGPARQPYQRPAVVAWGSLEALTHGGPASGTDDTMTGSTTFGFLFFGTDEWQLFRQGDGP